MIIKVAHTTEYIYTRPVFLEGQIIKLMPKSDDSQKLLSFEIKIDPQPVAITETKDIEANNIFNAWFEGLTDQFKIYTEFEVQTLKKNPFNFILDNRLQTLPVNYSEEEKQLLEPCLKIYSYKNAYPELLKVKEIFLKSENKNILNFLYELNAWIYNNCEYVIRDKGEPQTSDLTLKTLKGSCRDMAVLFIDICRLSGIAARFVSGYHYQEVTKEKYHMHAWAEVYLPGAGWIGYDPSLGLAVADNHIVVASSAFYKYAAPVAGAFRGDNAQSDLKTNLIIKQINCL